MNFHIMNVEPLGSVLGGGESVKVSQALLTDSYAVNNLELVHNWAAPDSPAGVWRFLSQSFAASKFFK